MAARVFFISILFTEVLRPACLAGIKGATCGIVGSNGSKSENLLGIRLDTEPSGDVVVGRSGAVLKCSVGDDQNVSWYRNGTAAPPCGSVRCRAGTKGELRFQMAQKQGDQGGKNSGNDKPESPESYRCVVKNDVGSLRSTSANVHIAYLSHEFNKSPEDVTVNEGEVARLLCSIDSIPSPPNITWQHKKQQLSFNDKTKYFMVSPGVLYINATKLSDAGSYRCIATNEFSKKKTRKSKEAKLHVNPIVERGNSAAPILLFPQISYSYRLIIGSNLNLVCASSGFPSLVIWTFNSSSTISATTSTSGHGDDAASQKPLLLLNSTNSIAVLTLKHVTAAHAGDYQCSVQSFGKTLQTQSITVDVLIPPTFTIRPEGGYEGCNGKTVRFECQAEGHPTPEVYWLKDSKPLKTNARQGTYVKENNIFGLSIWSSIPEDSGIYQCVAANDAGEIWAAAKLRIPLSPQNPPAPVSLNCHALSPESISLSWETPRTVQFSNNIAWWITVHYTEMEPGSRENTIVADENSSSINITSLEPFTNYSMYVRRWIKKAAGNQSAVIQCSTAASGMGTNDGRLTVWNKFVPIAAPVVMVHPISGTKLNVSWLPLDKKQARGHVTEYKLQWRLRDHPSNKVRNLSSSIKQYILTDLLPGSHYEVRVLARTQQGWPNVSYSLFEWTSVIMPLANSSQFPLTKLVHLDVTSVDASTIKVEWKIDKETAKHKENFDSWKLYYHNKAETKILIIPLPKNCTEYLFREIEANVSYGIELCMINSGESELCLLRQLHSKRPIDDYVPTNVEGVPVSSTSINVTWSAVSSNWEHCYEVCYRAAYSAHSEPNICLNTTDVVITIRFLKPYTPYQFRVTVLYNISEGESLYDETIECYTDEDVPGAVEEVDWFFSNPPEVHIVWKQPVEFNGVIRNYTVFYTSAPLSTDSQYWPNITVPGIRTTTILPGLAYNKLYFVEVRAATNAGYGKSSNRIMFRTGAAPKNPPVEPGDSNPPPKPVADQSLGIIVGVSISTCCILICLGSIYCRKKWENTQSPRESSQTLKDRVILRNGNGCCVERSSVSNSQRLPAATVTNEIELAVLCPPSPKTTNPYVCPLT